MQCVKLHLAVNGSVEILIVILAFWELGLNNTYEYLSFNSIFLIGNIMHKRTKHIETKSR